MKKLVFLLILPIITLTNTFNTYAIKNIELNNTFPTNKTI